MTTSSGLYPDTSQLTRELDSPPAYTFTKPSSNFKTGQSYNREPSAPPMPPSFNQFEPSAPPMPNNFYSPQPSAPFRPVNYPQHSYTQRKTLSEHLKPVADATSSVFNGIALRVNDFRKQFNELQEKSDISLGFKWRHLGHDFSDRNRYKLTTEENSGTFYPFQTNNELRLSHVALLVANIPFKVFNLASVVIEKVLRLTFITDIFKAGLEESKTPKYSLKQRAIMWVKDLATIPAAIISTALFPVINLLGATLRPKDCRRLYDLLDQAAPKTSMKPVQKLEIKLESFIPV